MSDPIEAARSLAKFAAEHDRFDLMNAASGLAEEIERLRKAVEDERDACAKIAEGETRGDLRSWPWIAHDYDNVSTQAQLADGIASAIRARSKANSNSRSGMVRNSTDRFAGE